MLKRFVKETNIHGFDQIHRSGTIGKIVWFILLLGGLALFGWSINDLMISYVHQHPTSSIQFRDFEYPPFALKVIDPNGVIGFGKGDYGMIEGVNSSKTSLDFVKMYFGMHTAGDDGKAWNQKKWRFENHDIVNELLEKASQPPKDIIMLPRGYNLIPASASNLHTPYRGLKYLIESNVTDKDSKPTAMKIIIGKCPRHFYIFAGSDAVSMDAPMAEQINCGNDVKVDISVRKYIWEDLFCSPKLAKYKGNCYASCAAEKAQEGDCSEYLGSVVTGKNTPICMTEKDMEEGRKHHTMKIAACRESCSKCDVCARPCEEFMIEMTHQLREGTVQQAEIDIKFPDVRQMVAVYTSRKTTPSMLISSIGGMLGLCVGASVLSLVHLLYFTCTCLARRKPSSAKKISNAEAKPKPEVQTV